MSGYKSDHESDHDAHIPRKAFQEKDRDRGSQGYSNDLRMRVLRCCHIMITNFLSNSLEKKQHRQRGSTFRRIPRSAYLV